VVLSCLLMMQVRGGIAEKDGSLRQGDQILSVDNHDMRSVSQEEAVNILKVYTTIISRDIYTSSI